MLIPDLFWQGEIMKGNWRYLPVGDQTWMMDNLHNHNPEEDIIRNMEPDLYKQEPQLKSGHEIIVDLPEKYREIVYHRLWEGETFQQIGDRMNCSRQWAHVLYNRGIDILKQKYPQINSLYDI